MQRTSLLLPRHNGDNAVVAELIHQLAAQAQIIGVLCHGADVLLGAAQRGQIELVGLVGQLGNALDVQRRKALDRCDHLQAVQIFAVVGKGCLRLGALGILVVQLGFFEVLLRQGSHLKIPAVIQRLDVVFGTVHGRHGSAGNLRGNNGALGRVVIGKDKAVGAKAQLGRHRQQVAILRFPVGFDANKIIGAQYAVRVIQPGEGVGFLVFGVHCQNHADGFQRLAVALEFGIDLPFGYFGTDGKTVHAVVAHNAAPQGVVQVQHQRLFVAPVNRFYNVGNAVGKRGNGIQTQGVLVHMPEKRIAPSGQTVIGGEVVDIIDIEILVRGGIGVEPLVQPADKVGAPVDVPDVAVAHQPIVGAVKVVLDHRAAELLRQRLPHGFKMGVLRIQHRVDVGGAVGGGGQVGQVAPCGVDVDDIRVKRIQLRAAEHGILPILPVFALIKLCFNAVLQQEKTQLVGNLVGGGAAQNGNFFVQRMGVLRQQLAAQAALFAQQGFGIQGIVEAIHDILPL